MFDYPVNRERIKTIRALSIVLIGFLIGILSGLLGIGGGALLVPAMVFLLGMSQHRAHGTSLVVILATVAFSAVIYGRNGHIDWAVAMELAAGGVIGAAIGAKMACKTSAVNLRTMFGLFLFILGLRMLWDVRYLVLAIEPAVQNAVILPGLAGGALMVGVGIVTGILSGLLGVGGAVIMIPAMVLLLNFPQKLAQGVSLAVIIPVSISGGLIHMRHGNVRWETALWLAVGGVLGGLAGSKIAMGLDPSVLGGLFGLLMVTMGLTTLIRGRRSKCMQEERGKEEDVEG